jgi:vacuolar-type H+-ATPase subunit I/STV1
MSTAEVELAKGQLDALIDRIAEGDKKVTPKDIMQANAEVQYAEARAVAQERAEQARRQNERQAKVDAVKNNLLSLDQNKIDSLASEVRQAVEAYISAVAEWDQQTSVASAELQELGDVPDADAFHRAGYRGGVRIGDLIRMQQRPQTVLSGIIRDVYRARYPRHQFSLDSPKD